MSSAEALAKEYECGDNEIGHGSGGKRSKAEQVEHAKPHPEGDTRRIINNALNGEEKRKEAAQGHSK